MKNNILILHHDDRDGYMSAAVISYYLESNSAIQNSDFRIITKKVNYEQPIKDVFDTCVSDLKKENLNYDFSKVYLVDYSISNDENAKEMIEIDKNYDLIWIDHHQSSIDYLTKFPKLNVIKGVRIVGISGAGLCWLYYCKDVGVETICNLLKPYDTSLKENLQGVEKVPIKVAEEILEFAKAPIFVLFTHRYDIFDLDDDVLKFNYGYSKLDIEEMKEFINPENRDKAELEFKTYIQNGEVIKDYLDYQNKKLVEEYGVEATYIGDREYKCIILNHTVFSSLVYGDTIKNYDFAVIYAIKKNTIRYSIYTVKDDVDVSIIAQKYNGGGHPKAAGFIMNKLLKDLKEWKFK